MWKRLVPFFSLLALLLVSTSCGPLAPQPGLWSYTDFQSLENKCKVDYVMNGGNTFQWKRREDGKYVLSSNDGAEEVVCTRREELLLCPSRSMPDWKPKNIPTTIKIKVRVEMTAVSGISVSGQQFGEATCEGLLCSVVERNYGMKFPCQFTTQFVAEWKR